MSDPESKPSRKSKSRLKVGLTVIYFAAEAHHTKTMRGAVEHTGSIFHPDLTEFAGTIGRIRPAGDTPGAVETADIGLIIPGQSNLKWVENVPEGDEHGSFRLISG